MVHGGGNLAVNARLRVHMLLGEALLVVEVGQDGHHAAPVPVVRHTTAIVDVTSRVDQHLVRTVV